MTTELLELRWILEVTVEGYPDRAKFLDAVIKIECFTADKLPAVSDVMRKPPVIRESGGDFFDNNEEM
ncbi:MAG: hypothetical protein M1457_01265 [bacterium]|nr:hypothetical protein [bacterium]